MSSRNARISHTQNNTLHSNNLTKKSNEHLVSQTNQLIDVNANITNGTQVAKIQGSDGSTIHGDGSGNVKTNVVNSVNINPANSSNADHANHSGHALAVGIRGRQSINDHTSGVFLLADSAGHLQTDVVNQPNVKVEDLSSSLNAQHASGTSRSLAVGLKGTTDISDVPSGSTFLLCDAAGHLQVDVVSTPAASGGATEAKQDVIETTLTAIETDAAALEVLQTSTNTKLDTLETTLTAIETDQAALEVLHTSTNSKLDTIDGVLDTIKIDTEAIETAVEALNTRDALTTTLIIDGQSVSAGGSHTSSSFEITKKPKGDGKLNFLIRISGVSAGEIQPAIQFSADDTNFFGADLGFITQGTAVTGVGQFFTCSFIPKHIKFQLSNTNFSSAATCSVHMFH